MKKETVLLVIVAAAVIAFGAGRMSNNVGSRAAAPAQPATVAPAPEQAKAEGTSVGGIPASMPVKGPENALVTIVEVSDFQCPFCSRVGPTIKELMKLYPNDLKIVWANQPLPFHNNAKPAAIAALAAHKQGKFWEMHDKMFENQQTLSSENYEKWAKELGLNVDKFKTDLKDAAIAKQVDAEQAAANATGAGGTPSFFINGKLIQGAQPVDEFKKAIDAALADAKAVSAGKTGIDQIKAAATKHGGETGTKVVEYFLEGKAPAAAAEAPARAGQPEAKAEEGPAVAPPDSFDVWKVPVDPKRDAVKGGDSFLVTVVEISDFECPFCSRGANAMTEIEKAYGDKVRLVFKHHPLPFHKNARAAHLASIAAAKQGKFWQFHDKAFQNQQGLTEENLVAWAKELGLDMAKFDAVRKDPATDKQIGEDMEMAGGIGIRGTPGFFINGRKIVGAQPVPVFKVVIDEEIKKAEAAGKKGLAYYSDIESKGKVFTELNDKVNEFNVEGLPFKGPKDAPITIVEFSDFQCPYCSRLAEPIKTAMEANPGKIKVVFAHFPLSFHQQAKPASALAQMAFEKLGSEKFWEAHDLLFAAQRELGDEKFKEIAGKVGLKWEEVDAAIKGNKYEDLIKKTMEMGEKGGVEGTPSIYINGRKFEPAAGYTPEAFGKAFTLLKK